MLELLVVRLQLVLVVIAQVSSIRYDMFGVISLVLLPLTLIHPQHGRSLLILQMRFQIVQVVLEQFILIPTQVAQKQVLNQLYYQQAYRGA